MTNKRLAMLVLAGSITLAGCGTSPTAPSAGSQANAGLSQPAAVTQPAPEAAKAQPAKAAAPAVVTAPAANAAATTNASTQANATVSDNAAAAATATAAGNLTGNLNVKGGMGYQNTDFVVFASDRYPSEGNNDIYVFDPLQDTVLAIVGVNTYNNEFNPRMSDNGKWLVFQRTVGYKQDVLLYSMDAKLVNTLHNLNTEEYDEYMPDVTNDGCKIVYVSNADGYPEIRLYDVTTGDNWVVPGANRNFADITWPTISANGLKIAYGASIAPGYGYPATDGTYNPTGGPAYTGGALYPAQSDIYIYDVAHGVQLTPPFINTAFDEYNPDLCSDGSRILFVSNRLGTEDIFEVNLDTGFTDNLAFLNTYELDEQHPRYLGGNVDRIVYQIKYPDATYPVALRAYNRTSATVDTLPVANQLFADSALRAPQPEVADVTP